MSTGACAQRAPFETLAAWWTRDLDERASSDLEEHLFSCDECAARSEALGRLVGGLCEVIPPVISEAHRTRLVERGMRVRSTACPADGTATAHFGKDVDLLVHELKGDLSRAESVDVEVRAQDGSLTVRLDHVPFDARSGQVLIACQRHYQLFYGEGENPTFHVHVTEKGKPRKLGEYYVVHVWE